MTALALMRLIGWECHVRVYLFRRHVFDVEEMIGWRAPEVKKVDAEALVILRARPETGINDIFKPGFTQ